MSGIRADGLPPVGRARVVFADRWLPHARALLSRSGLDPSEVVLLVLDVSENMAEKVVDWHERLEPTGRIAERIDEALAYIAVLRVAVAREVLSGQPVVMQMLGMAAPPGRVRVAAGAVGGWATMMVPVDAPPTTPTA